MGDFPPLHSPKLRFDVPRTHPLIPRPPYLFPTNYSIQRKSDRTYSRPSAAPQTANTKQSHVTHDVNPPPHSDLQEVTIFQESTITPTFYPPSGPVGVQLSVISVRWRWYQKVPCLEGFTVRSASIPTRLRPAAATAAASLLASIRQRSTSY